MTDHAIGGSETTALDEQLELLDGHQHGSSLGPLTGPDDAARLEQIHDATGPSEPDLELALQHGRRPQLAAHHEFDGLAHERLVLVVAAATATATAGRGE